MSTSSNIAIVQTGHVVIFAFCIVPNGIFFENVIYARWLIHERQFVPEIGSPRAYQAQLIEQFNDWESIIQYLITIEKLIARDFILSKGSHSMVLLFSFKPWALTISLYIQRLLVESKHGK